VNGLLHPISPLGPFEKWGVNLVGPFLVTMRGHRFIVVAINYLIRFAKIHALKSLMNKKVT
jgi:hypothetical protein